MDSKTTVATLAIGAATVLVTIVRYGLIYKRKDLSSISARLIFTMLITLFLLFVIAGVISYYYRLSISSLVIGILIFTIIAILICSAVIGAYFLLKGRRKQ